EFARSAVWQGRTVISSEADACPAGIARNRLTRKTGRKQDGNIENGGFEKILWHGGEPGKGPGWREPFRGGRRIRGGGGDLRVREEHPASHAGRAGLSHFRQRDGGGTGTVLLK